MINNLAIEIYGKTEDSIYELLSQHMEFNSLEQTMVYMHFRAYYLVLSKLYIKKFEKDEIKFDELFANYKMQIVNYYKENNPGIPDILIQDLMNSFDASFQLIESIKLDDVLDYELLKNFTKEVLESLHAILERRSKRVISMSFINNTEIFCNSAKEVKELIRNF